MSKGFQDKHFGWGRAHLPRPGKKFSFPTGPRETQTNSHARNERTLRAYHTKRQNSTHNQARYDAEDWDAEGYNLARDGDALSGGAVHLVEAYGSSKSFRRDSDGKYYSKDEFIEYYGGSRLEPPDEWFAAADECFKAAPMRLSADAEEDEDEDEDKDDDEWVLIPKSPSLAETGRALFFRTMSGAVDEEAFPALSSS